MTIKKLGGATGNVKIQLEFDSNPNLEWGKISTFQFSIIVPWFDFEMRNLSKSMTYVDNFSLLHEANDVDKNCYCFSDLHGVIPGSSMKSQCFPQDML